ncbi:MAG: thiopeptide-type bacteriocin biosynthesis protein, partial [Bacteroidota bacterium]
MNPKKNDTWLSVHLYYNEPWEEFLQKALEPYVNTAVQTGIAQQYFFIRYWENGPHIRLRMKGEEEMINTILKPNLEEHFTHYFESKPSRRTEPQYPPNFSETLKWFLNNSISYNEYQPEVGRFGGKLGIQIAEKQFMISSKVVL